MTLGLVKYVFYAINIIAYQNPTRTNVKYQALGNQGESLALAAQVWRAGGQSAQ